MAFTDYRGLNIYNGIPTGPAGVVLNDDFSELANRSGPILSAAFDPTVNDDSSNTAGNGKLYQYSKWLNTMDNGLFICVDDALGAAVWHQIHWDGIAAADFNETITFDGTQVIYQPDQVDFAWTLIVGDGGGALTHAGGSEGRYNTVFGIDSFNSTTTGDSNVVVGPLALQDNTTGNRNLAIGYASQQNCITGNYNVAIGDEVLFTNTAGDRNVCIGTRAGQAIQGNDNVCLGHMAGRAEMGSDKLYISNTDTTKPLIYGDFNTDIVKIHGDLYVPSDSKFISLGAVSTDWQLQWDGSNAVQTIVAGEFRFEGGNVNLRTDNQKIYFGDSEDAYIEFDGSSLNIKANEDNINDTMTLIGATVQVDGKILATDKVQFTQTDGDEYIDSLADGFMDYGATTAHRFLADVKLTSDTDKLYFGAGDDATVTFNGSELIITGNTVCATDTVQLVGTTITNTGKILATDKVQFTQVDGNEYIDSLNDGFVDYGATTAHRFLADVKITSDTDKLYFGAGDDATVTFNGSELIITGNTVCATDTVQLVGTTITNTGKILATDKVQFTQVDGNEYIDSLNDGFVDYGATTAHRFLADVKITSDTDKLYFGAGDDASLTYNGTDLLINPRAVGSGNTSFTGNIGVGTANCEYLVDMNATGAGTEGMRMYSNSFLEWKMQVNSNTAAARSMFRGTRSRGTKATPLAVQSGDYIFSFLADGYGTSYAGAGEIDVIATQNWTVAARGNKWVFQNVTNNTIALKEALVIEHDGVIQTINKVSFTQTDQNEYIDSLADGFMDYGATTAHRFDNDVKITQDNDKLYLGAGDDASITYDGVDLLVDPRVAGTGNTVFTGDVSQMITLGGFNRRISEAVGVATANTTFDIQVNVPTGSRILGCQLRVDTALTSSDGGVAWTAAYLTGATQQIGTGLAFAQNTKHNQMFDANAATDITSGEVDIQVTCDAAKTFIAGGVVRAIVYYENFTTMANV